MELISYVFYCFVNFLCISLFFRPFVFYCFFDEICWGHFCNHKQHKINSFQPVKAKIFIHLWFLAENTISIDLYTKSRFWAILGLTCMYKKSRSVVTVCPIFAKTVSKDAQDLKVKSRRATRWKNFARRHGREIRQGGSTWPPPPVNIGLRILHNKD